MQAMAQMGSMMQMMLMMQGGGKPKSFKKPK
jgi:hypothetical protein